MSLIHEKKNYTLASYFLRGHTKNCVILWGHMRQPKRLKILNIDNGVTLDELETLKQRLFHLRINEDGPVAMKLRLLDSSGFEDID